MEAKLYTMVMLPRFNPYPRYGRLERALENGQVEVTQVHCGDPRCAAEHQHANETWSSGELEATAAYQGRASWEQGRKISQNAVVDEASTAPATKRP